MEPSDDPDSNLWKLSVALHSLLKMSNLSCSQLYYVWLSAATQNACWVLRLVKFRQTSGLSPRPSLSQTHTHIPPRNGFQVHENKHRG